MFCGLEAHSRVCSCNNDCLSREVALGKEWSSKDLAAYHSSHIVKCRHCKTITGRGTAVKRMVLTTLRCFEIPGVFYLHLPMLSDEFKTPAQRYAASTIFMLQRRRTLDFTDTIHFRPVLVGSPIIEYYCSFCIWKTLHLITGSPIYGSSEEPAPVDVEMSTA